MSALMRMTQREQQEVTYGAECAVHHDDPQSCSGISATAKVGLRRICLVLEEGVRTEERHEMILHLARTLLAAETGRERCE